MSAWNTPPKLRKVLLMTYEAHWDCPNCDGEMEFDGITLTTYPPMYPHTCPKCGHCETADQVYPTVVYERAKP